MYSLAAGNPSQLILSVTFVSQVVGFTIPEKIKSLAGIRHFVCQLVRTLVNKAVALHAVWQR